MRFNFKKITAIAVSALMTGMTLGVAAAAAFPSDFTTAVPGIVYGASADPMDATQANSIGDYLADKVPKTGGEVTGGDSILLEKASTKFHMSEGMRTDIIGTAVTATSPGSGMPTLLADGKYIDNDNDEFDYVQKINLANFSLTMFDDNDYKDDTPTVGVKIANGAEVLNYTLDFTDKPYFSDLTNSDLLLMGKSYYVLSVTENTSAAGGSVINLLDSAADTTLSEGETKTLNVGGKAYEVGIDFIGTSTVILSINGETTNTLSAAQTQRLSDGAFVGIKSINTQDYAGGIKRVEFAIGKGKLKLTDGSDIELNDDSITGLKYYVDESGDGTDDQVSIIHLKWSTSKDQFVTDSTDLTMPGLEVVKLSFGGMVYPAEEKIKVSASSATAIILDDFPLKDSVEDIPYIYAINTSAFACYNVTSTGIGKDIDNQLATSGNATLIFNNTKDDMFIASWSDGDDSESYLMTVTDWKIESGVPKATFKYKKNGIWEVAKKDAKAQDTVSIGNTEFTINGLNDSQQYANITVGTNVNFSTLYSKEGMKVFLPQCINASRANIPGALNATINGSYNTFSIVMAEEDKDGNIMRGGNVTVVVGFNSASTPEVHVSSITYSTQWGDEDATAAEIGSTDIYRNFIYTPLATETLWDKNGDQYKADLIYHGGESYGKMYIASSSASIGTAGNMVFTDAEKTSWQAKNVILVGGSCINTATATALGVASGTCSAAFTSATGVGTGKFLIQTVADKFATGKIALVVAGYEKDDTAAAASRLINNPATIDTTAGNKYIGVVGSAGTSTISKVA